MPSGSSASWASVLHGLGSRSIPTRRGSSISAATDQMGLTIRRTDGTSFTFLGFAHIWGKSRAGNKVVRQVTAKNRYARALAAVTAWCRFNRHQPIPDQHAHLTAMMRGHYAYYGITGNSRRLSWYACQSRADLAEDGSSRRDRGRRSPLESVQCTSEASPSAGSPDRPSLHYRERGSPMKNRKREICTSGSVRDEDGQHPHLLGRRSFLHLAVGAAALPVVSRMAWAQAYPTRPVHMIVGLATGGPTDVMARIVGQSLSERLGKQFPVENRTGAGGSLATLAVINAPPDGYMLLFGGPTVTIGASLYRKLSRVLEELTPISGVMRFPN